MDIRVYLIDSFNQTTFPSYPAHSGIGLEEKGNGSERDQLAPNTSLKALQLSETSLWSGLMEK